MRSPQSHNMIRLRRCADLPNPSPPPSGTTECDCCDAPCWLSQGSVDLLASFPLLTLLCIECADAVLAATGKPTIVAQVPHNAAELRVATALLTHNGELVTKRGQS